MTDDSVVRRQLSPPTVASGSAAGDVATLTADGTLDLETPQGGGGGSLPAEPTPASGSTSYGANKDLTFTAIPPGTSGNLIEVDYYNDGASQPLTVLVAGGTTVEVHLATSGGGASTSTANDVLAALQGDADCSALISVALKAGSNGTGVIPTASFDFVTLAGGANGDSPVDTGLSILMRQASKNTPLVKLIAALANSPGLFEVVKVETVDGQEIFRLRVDKDGAASVTLGTASLQVASESGSQFKASAGMTADIVSVDDVDDNSLSGFDKDGRFWTNVLTDDGVLGDAHRLFINFDPTHGAARLHIKAIDANGDTVTGDVALT